MSRWYVANVVFRPKDENGLPLAYDTVAKKPRKTALLDHDRYWDTYIGFQAAIAKELASY